MTADNLESNSENSLKTSKQSRWSKKRKLIIGGIALFVIVLGIALGVGLGVGLNQGGGGDDDSGDDGDGSNNNNGSGNGNGSDSGTPVPTVTPVANPQGVWRPEAGTSWDYQLGQKVNSTAPNGTTAWGLDLYETAPEIITGLQSNGAKVICYFSAGSWEDWRNDASNFTNSDKGKVLDGWPHEKWLNTKSNNVRRIMLTRLDLAQQKGCDGVDPDNVDAYNNKNGLGLTQQDAVDYMTWLAGATQARNLSIGLKNAGDIIPNVINFMQWSVNEQCVEFQECDVFQPFIAAGKPVFHVEYPKGDNTNNDDLVTASVKNKFCDDSSAKGFSSIIKNINLNAWIEKC